MKISRKQLRKMINESMTQVRNSIYSDDIDERNAVKVRVNINNRTFAFMTPDGQVIHGSELRNHPDVGGNVAYILTKGMREIQDTISGDMGSSTDPTARIQELKRRLSRVAFDLGYDFADFVNI